MGKFCLCYQQIYSYLVRSGEKGMEQASGNVEPHFPVTVLLVDDQPIIAEAIRRMLVDQPDIALYYCQDPTQAIALAEKISPTVILQDLVMPEIDGLLLVKYFRANSLTRNIPMIVLSSKEEPVIKADAFALGANDYIVKLPDQIELVARIRYHSAAYIRLLERNVAYEKLARSQRALQQELNEAAGYVRSTLPPPIKGKVATSWLFEPSTILGGDAFGYDWLDPENFAFYLLDVCGHGVGAALLSTSITNLLRNRTLPNADFYQPSSVLASLNETYKMENHNNMFFTMWYGVYNALTRVVTYSNGGHPPPVLFTGPSAESMERSFLSVPGMVVGGMPNVVFEEATVTVGPYNRLYVFSDGVYEITKPDGTMMIYDDFVRFLEMLPPDRTGVEDMERVLAYGKSFIGGSAFADDFSILKLVFS